MSPRLFKVVQGCPILTRREIAALALAFVVTLPAVTTRLYASDEVQYFAWLRSLAFDRDADFENEYQHFYDTGIARSSLFHETFLERTNPAGRRMNFTTLGSALLWSPFYAVGHVAALITGAAADGFSRPYIAAVAYGSAVYAFLAVLLSAAIARRVVGNGIAASVIVAIGSPLLFYAYVAPGFGHATSAFAVSLLVWTWLRVRATWSEWGAFLLGLCGGLVAIVREQDGLLLLGPAVDFLLSIRDRRQGPAGLGNVRDIVMSAICGLSGFAIAIAPQAAAYVALNGRLGPDASVNNKLTWYAPHALGVLFSPKHGLLAWTPLVALSLLGLALLAFRRPAQAVSATRDASRLGALALLMFAAQVYTSGSVESWTVAGSFGQRRFLAVTPLLVLGLAALFQAARTTLVKRVLVTAALICIWWNLGLMLQFGSHRMDRQRLTLAENARVTFVELPFQAPALVWRYFTNRSSFFEPRQ
jgi:hypothetical protein